MGAWDVSHTEPDSEETRNLPGIIRLRINKSNGIMYSETDVCPAWVANSYL